MKDSKIFDDFNGKLSDIVNNLFNLGEPIPESKVVRKILRSLHPKFIEKTKDLDTLTVEELVVNLQTYEANHIPTLEPKGMALVSSKHGGGDSDDAMENNSKNEELEALFVKKFKKFLNRSKGDMERSFLKNKAQNMYSYVPSLISSMVKVFQKILQKASSVEECQG